MELNDDDFNLALKISLEWGPVMAIPADKRIAAAIPTLSPDDIAALLRRFHDISVASSAAVSAGLRDKTPESAMRADVAAIDPKVSAENASTLFFQARYGAWRDGEG